VNSNSLESLVRIGNRAKMHGYLWVANFVFAALIQHWLDEPQARKSLKVYWMTQDTEGRWIREVYYDLVTFEVGGELLSVPVPLLKRNTVISLLKAAEVIERDECHYDDSGPDDEASMGESFDDLVRWFPADEIFSAAFAHLEDSVFEQMANDNGIIEILKPYATLLNARIDRRQRTLSATGAARKFLREGAEKGLRSGEAITLDDVKRERRNRSFYTSSGRRFIVPATTEERS